MSDGGKQEHAALDPKDVVLSHEKLRKEINKLDLEIGELRHARSRFVVSNTITVVLACATLALGIAGFTLNATINNATNRQHEFENYYKLIEQFGKGGTERVGAIVGLRQYLAPTSDKAPQTISFLANDLTTESDPVAIRSTVATLASVGIPAFDATRSSNQITSLRMRLVLLNALRDDIASSFQQNQNREKAIDWRTYVSHWFPEGYLSGSQYDWWLVEASNDVIFYLQNRGYGKTTEPLDIRTQYIELNFAGIMELSLLSMPSLPPKNSYWRDQIGLSAERLLATNQILRAILHGTETLPNAVDASLLTLYQVDFRDKVLRGINLSRSFISGYGDGADLRFADLHEATVELTLGASKTGAANLCGANLADTFFPHLTVSKNNGGLTPVFAGTDWWDAFIPGEAMSRIEQVYPKPKDALHKLSQPDRDVACSKATYAYPIRLGP